MTPEEAKIIGASLVGAFVILAGAPHLQLDRRVDMLPYAYLAVLVVALLALIHRQV